MKMYANMCELLHCCEEPKHDIIRAAKNKGHKRLSKPCTSKRREYDCMLAVQATVVYYFFVIINVAIDILKFIELFLLYPFNSFQYTRHVILPQELCCIIDYVVMLMGFIHKLCDFFYLFFKYKFSLSSNLKFLTYFKILNLKNKFHHF